MNEKLPKVSIVLPTYNASKYIRQSIDSCLNQTYRNIELIIVDDCSNDNTQEFIKSYKDERVSYIKHEKNMGLPSALNTGFSHATGEYLTWTSDDNLYQYNAIETMLKFLQANNYEFVYCDYYAFEVEDKKNARLVRLPDRASFEQINCVRACFLYTRKVMEETGKYDPETELVEDYDYWIRASQRFTLKHLAQPLYFYREHKQSLYGSRYWEVEVAKFLIRLKYDIVDREKANYYLRQLIVQQKRMFFILHRIKAKILFTKVISIIINDFKNKKIDFSEARTYLNALIIGKSSEKNKILLAFRA